MSSLEVAAGSGWAAVAAVAVPYGDSSSTRSPPTEGMEETEDIPGRVEMEETADSAVRSSNTWELPRDSYFVKPARLMVLAMFQFTVGRRTGGTYMVVPALT